MTEKKKPPDWVAFFQSCGTSANRWEGNLLLNRSNFLAAALGVRVPVYQDQTALFPTPQYSPISSTQAVRLFPSSCSIAQTSRRIFSCSVMVKKIKNKRNLHRIRQPARLLL